MSRYICLLAAICVAVGAAPPSPPRLYQQQAPAHLQNIHPLDYFMDNSEVAAYYNQAQQKQGEREPPARLENLEPDSEVELIPGAQQPQQPPQQNPVAPNVPGFAPGQRGVFIVHMPVPGYRPGTIGGYQPIYIVAAAPQGHNAYAANGIPTQGVQGGYQNAILVNPSAVGPGQVVSPYFGFPGAQAQFPGQGQYPVGQQAGLLFGAGPIGYRGFEPIYQQQVDPAFAYQQVGQPQQGEDPRGQALHLTQLVGLQSQPAHPASNQQRIADAAQNSESKRVGEASESIESKEALREQPRFNARPSPAHAQRNNKV